MKRLLLFFSLLFSLSFYAQNDTISVVQPQNIELEPVAGKEDDDFKGLNSVYAQNDTIPILDNSKISFVSADKTNVVYRGISNPISVKVPDGIEYSVSAPGLLKRNDQYYLNPGSGTEVMVIVVYKTKEGKSVSEAHKFKIVNIPPFELRINTIDSPYIICSKCIFETTKSDLKRAIFKLSLNRAFLYDIDLNISSIEFEFPNHNLIRNEGAMVSEEVFNEINKLKTHTVFTIKISLQGNSKISIPIIKAMLSD